MLKINTIEQLKEEQLKEEQLRKQDYRYSWLNTNYNKEKLDEMKKQALKRNEEYDK